MKYLKTYKLFESDHQNSLSMDHDSLSDISENLTEDFLSDIHDIVLDIEDSGLSIEKYKVVHDLETGRSHDGTDKIKIRIVKKNGQFWDRYTINQEISDTLERLNEYVKRLGWSYCTFDVYIDNKEQYQLSGSDIIDFIGRQVFCIEVNITDYRGPHWYEMRYGKNESIMKYLKTYNQVNEVSFNDLEKSANLRDECRDILFDISDDDTFTVNTWVEESDVIGVYDSFVVAIGVSDEICTDDKGVKFSEEQIESIKRLFDYLDSNGYVYKVEIGTDNIPPMPDVNLDNYRGEIKPEDFNLAELWVGDYIRIDIKR